MREADSQALASHSLIWETQLREEEYGDGLTEAHTTHGQGTERITDHQACPTARQIRGPPMCECTQSDVQQSWVWIWSRASLCQAGPSLGGKDTPVLLRPKQEGLSSQAAFRGGNAWQGQHPAQVQWHFPVMSPGRIMNHPENKVSCTGGRTAEAHKACCQPGCWPDVAREGQPNMAESVCYTFAAVLGAGWA